MRSNTTPQVLAKEEELNYTIDAIAEAEHTSRVLEKMKHRAERTSAELKAVTLKRQKEVEDHAHDVALLADEKLEPVRVCEGDLVGTLRRCRGRVPLWAVVICKIAYQKGALVGMTALRPCNATSS